MTIVQFLTDWTIRSSLLIAIGALLLWMLRVKDPSIRVGAWTAMLAASLAIPALTHGLPGTPIDVNRIEASAAQSAPALKDVATAPIVAAPAVHSPSAWRRALFMAWTAGVFVLLLRLVTGLVLSFGLLRRSRATDRAIDGISIRESGEIAAPVTIGIFRPSIVVPPDWSEWPPARLDAVLAHECSHIRRHDPAVQVLSAIHRALQWHNPFAWFLHLRIVRTAEEASDDAALALTGDRVFYAEVLLDFIQRGSRGTAWMGVPMARHGRADQRIHRILDGTTLSRGLTGWAVTAITVVVAPLACIIASAHPSHAAPQAPPPRIAQPGTAPAPPQQPGVPAASTRGRASGYLNGLGTVTATTISVRARVEGELKSVGFDEGKPVQPGQLLASIDPHDAQAQLEQALVALARDKQRLAMSAGLPSETVVDIENHVNADQREAENLKREVVYGQVRAPFAGVAGLRKIDPGNFVHSGDTLVVITQVQPIAVVFNLPEDELPRVQALLKQGTPVIVEAWSRDVTSRLATGRLTAMDNLIDESSGMLKLKAAFENKDGALFPNQFVNVRLLLDGR